MSGATAYAHGNILEDKYAPGIVHSLLQSHNWNIPAKFNGDQTKGMNEILSLYLTHTNTHKLHLTLKKVTPSFLLFEIASKHLTTENVCHVIKFCLVTRHHKEWNVRGKICGMVDVCFSIHNIRHLFF